MVIPEFALVGRAGRRIGRISRAIPVQHEGLVFESHLSCLLILFAQLLPLIQGEVATVRATEVGEVQNGYFGRGRAP